MKASRKLINWSRPGFTFTQKFDEIKHNVEIDDVRFEKPAK